MSRVVVVVEDNSDLLALLAEQAAERAEEAAAEVLAAEVRARVPVNTGRLRDSYHVDRDVKGRVVVTNRKDTFYGQFVEFGTTRAPAEPHVRPAMEGSRLKVAAAVRVHMQEVVR